MSVVHKLDNWWETHSAGRRYDRGPMYFWMMVACMITGLSLLIIGPTPQGSIDKLDDGLEKVLAVLLFSGSAVCTFAATTGSRFWFPRWSRVLSYGVGLVGLPIVISSLMFYAYAVSNNTDNFTSALGGAFALLLALGAAINGVYFWLEMRRITRNVKFIKETDPDVG